MKDTSLLPSETTAIPAHTNFISLGEGAPVVMVHGLAASHHDWDDLIPELVSCGYAAYALDLLGHGESPKPRARAYQMDWMSRHLSGWIEALELDEPAVLIGHSLGGYLILDYARRFPERVRALVLANPFYRLEQLPALLRLVYHRPLINTAVVRWTPGWLFRLIVDGTSISMGHSNGGVHNLPEHVRAQTALDYMRTAPGVYNLPNSMTDLVPSLPEITHPTLAVWGTRDTTLPPSSFADLVSALPNVTAKTLPAGHVPHQSHTQEFNELVLEFLQTL